MKRWEVESAARDIVKALMDDLDNRRGFHLPKDDEIVMEEWYNTWHDKVLTILESYHD